MRRTLFRAAAAAAALALVAGSWILLVATGDHEEPDPVPAETTTPPVRPARAASPRTTAAPGDEAARADVAADAVADADAEPPPPEAPRALLEVHVVGLDADVPAAPTIVTVSHGRQGDVVDADDTPVTKDGGTAARFRVDVSSLVPASGGLTVLDVIAEREGYLTATGETHTSGPRGPSSGPTMATVQLRMQVAGWVRGVVQDERFRRVEGADVGAFVMRQNRFSRVDTARTDAEGVFRLRLHPGETHLVAVVARGLEPASSQVTGLARAETELAPFTLRPGLAISGTARRADGSALEEARVLAQPVWAETDLVLLGTPLAYRAGQAFLCPAADEAEGVNFAIPGLAPGDFDVSLFVESAAADLLATTRRRVQPPAEGLLLELAASTLIVEAGAEEGAAPRRVRFALKDAEGVATAETDADGEARFLVRPRGEYELSASPPGYFPETRTVRASAEGETERVAVRFRRSRPPSRLVLRLRPEDASGEERVRSAIVEVQEFDRPGVAYRTETVTFDAAWGEIVGLPQGAYLLIVKPTPEGYRLPARHRVGVTEGGIATLGLRFPLGGRLNVRATSEEGTEIDATFAAVSRSQTGVERACNEAQGALLPPGRWSVLVYAPERAEGAAKLSLQASVQPGKTTTVTARIPGAAPPK